MNQLQGLMTLLQTIQSEELEGLNWNERQQKMKPYSEQYKSLLSKWISDAKAGMAVPLEEIQDVLDQELQNMKARYGFVSPKMIHPYWMVHGFRNRLHTLAFEMAKRQAHANTAPCFCSLRHANNVVPDFNYLNKFGRAILYHEDDDFLVYNCKCCGFKWINTAGYDSLSISNTWREWNPEGDYLLRERYNQ